MAVPFDARRLQVSGAPVGLIADVMQGGEHPTDSNRYWGWTIRGLRLGPLVYATGGVYAQDRWSLVWVDRTGRSEALRVAPGSYHAPRSSPDGRRVAFNSSTGDWDLWTYDVPRGIAARVPMDGDQSGALWTPDGSRLTFSSAVKGHARCSRSIRTEVVGRAVDADEPLRRGRAFPNAWTSDGRSLASLTIATSGCSHATERRSVGAS